MKPGLRFALWLFLSVGLAHIGRAMSWAEIRPIEVKRAGRAREEGGALKHSASRVNSAERDYGAKLEQWRSQVVRSSIASPRFWTMLSAWIVLLLMFLTVMHQGRERERREVVAAQFLAQYHNAWVHATRQAQAAIARCNELAEKLNREPEVVEALNAAALLARAECERESASSPATIFPKSGLKTPSELSTATARRPASKVRAGKLAESESNRGARRDDEMR